MSPNQTKRFVKLWRNIERAEQQLDFRKAEWSRDVRKLAKTDAEFVRWCNAELSLSRNTAEELLRRAKLFAVVPDVTTWNKLGGYDKMQALVTHDLSRKEQLEIIEAAMASGYAPKTGPITKIMQQRGYLPAPFVSHRSFSVIAAPISQEIKRLAEFIDATYKNPPDDIVRIISKYMVAQPAQARSPQSSPNIPTTRVKQTVEIVS